MLIGFDFDGVLGLPKLVAKAGVYHFGLYRYGVPMFMSVYPCSIENML
jgi:hypothetical protein